MDLILVFLVSVVLLSQRDGCTTLEKVVCLSMTPFDCMGRISSLL
jgi:hypothetical protein